MKKKAKASSKVRSKDAPDDPKPGMPKRAHREYVSGGKHLNKDTRRELREKH